jgi:uncharacterized protein involved in exopolysaccharide biosynthesis
MELRAYARVLLRRWWLPLLFAALASGGAYVASSRATPTYRATAQLSVTPSIVDYFTGEAVQRLLNNYSLQLKSRGFAALVAEQLGTAGAPPAGPTGNGGAYSPPLAGGSPALQGKIKAVASPSEYRIAIEVDDADPGRAQAIANAAAQAFVEKMQAENAGREKHDVEVQVLDLAERPGAPVSPSPKRTAAGAGLLGAALGVGAVFLLEYLDDHGPLRRPGARLAGRSRAGSAGRSRVGSAEPSAGARRRLALAHRRRDRRGPDGPDVPDSPPSGGVRQGEVVYGLGHRRPAGRGDLHEAALAGGRGIPDAPH